MIQEPGRTLPYKRLARGRSGGGRVVETRLLGSLLKLDLGYVHEVSRDLSGSASASPRPDSGTNPSQTTEPAPRRHSPNESRQPTAGHAVVVPERRPMPLFTRYLVPVVAVGIAFVLTALLEPFLARIIFVLFWPAVILTAATAGLGPAILASLLAVLVVEFWFLP